MPSLTASENPAVLIYQDSYARMPTDQLEVAVWSDGRIVWRSGGGLLEARIEPEKIDGLVQELHREGVFGDGNAEYVNVGPDADFEVIDIRLPDRRLRLESWHELFEQNPNAVVTSHGVELLDGRVRDKVLAAEPAQYQRFRRVWSDIRSAVKSWVPDEGIPYVGTVPLGR